MGEGVNMNSLIVVGIRPQFIHLYGLLKEGALPEDCTVVNTGQHKDWQMSGIFSEELKLPKMVNLGMSSKEDGEYRLARFVWAHDLSKIYVIGDSTTTTIGAMVAKAMGIHLTHIEAGLRCSEFIPEEVNRRFVDSVADELWAPTDYARDNLLHEIGFPHGIGYGEKCYLKDGVLVKVNRVKRTENFRLCAFREIVKRVEADSSFDVVCEFHRQDNVDNVDRFNKIRKALQGSKRTVLWSVHPRIIARHYSWRSKDSVFGGVFHLEEKGNLTATPPLSYSKWLSYLKGCRTVITDSGGIQLEAYELGKDIVTLRSDVEWKHTLDRCTLVGDDLSKLEDALTT
jgi:UDP-N-acetylglucosamine 2-epimerase